jgi:hypothetical protein
MYKALLVSAALGLAVVTGAWAQQGATTAPGGEVPGQAGKEGTGATGGVPGAAAAPGTQGGPAPGAPAVAGEGVPGQEGKEGTSATGGAPGASAAPGTQGGPAPAQGGCQPGVQPQQGQQC